MHIKFCQLCLDSICLGPRLANYTSAAVTACNQILHFGEITTAP